MSGLDCRNDSVCEKNVQSVLARCLLLPKATTCPSLFVSSFLRGAQTCCPSLFVSPFLHGAQVEKVMTYSKECQELPPHFCCCRLLAAARVVSFLAAACESCYTSSLQSSSCSSYITFQKWNQMLSPLEAVDARWRSSAPLSVISKVGITSRMRQPSGCGARRGGVPRRYHWWSCRPKWFCHRSYKRSGWLSCNATFSWEELFVRRRNPLENPRCGKGWRKYSSASDFASQSEGGQQAQEKTLTAVINTQQNECSHSDFCSEIPAKKKDR